MVAWFLPAALVLGPGAEPAGARTAALQAADPLRTTAAQYLSEAKQDSKDIVGPLGHSLRLTMSVVVNTKQLFGQFTRLTFGDDSSGGTSGAPAECEIHINPDFTKQDAECQRRALIHEVFHCYQAMDYPTVAAFQAE
jgi:hypothetical protein